MESAGSRFDSQTCHMLAMPPAGKFLNLSKSHVCICQVETFRGLGVGRLGLEKEQWSSLGKTASLGRWLHLISNLKGRLR